MCVCVYKCMPLEYSVKGIESTLQVQILSGAVFISQNVNAFGKGMNLSFPAMGE